MAGNARSQTETIKKRFLSQNEDLSSFSSPMESVCGFRCPYFFMDENTYKPNTTLVNLVNCSVLNQTFNAVGCPLDCGTIFCGDCPISACGPSPETPLCYDETSSSITCAREFDLSCHWFLDPCPITNPNSGSQTSPPSASLQNSSVCPSLDCEFGEAELALMNCTVFNKTFNADNCSTSCGSLVCGTCSIPSCGPIPPVFCSGGGTPANSCGRRVPEMECVWSLGPCPNSSTEGDKAQFGLNITKDGALDNTSVAPSACIACPTPDISYLPRDAPPDAFIYLSAAFDFLNCTQYGVVVDSDGCFTECGSVMCGTCPLAACGRPPPPPFCGDNIPEISCDRRFDFTCSWTITNCPPLFGPCEPSDCGSTGSNYLCDDGFTIAGPGPCLRNSDGVCSRSITKCPVCPNITCDTPPGCQYEFPAFDMNHCQTACGELRCGCSSFNCPGYCAVDRNGWDICLRFMGPGQLCDESASVPLLCYADLQCRPLEFGSICVIPDDTSGSNSSVSGSGSDFGVTGGDNSSGFFSDSSSSGFFSDSSSSGSFSDSSSSGSFSDSSSSGSFSDSSFNDFNDSSFNDSSFNDSSFNNSSFNNSSFNETTGTVVLLITRFLPVVSDGMIQGNMEQRNLIIGDWSQDIASALEIDFNDVNWWYWEAQNGSALVAMIISGPQQTLHAAELRTQLDNPQSALRQGVVGSQIDPTFASVVAIITTPAIVNLTDPTGSHAQSSPMTPTPARGIHPLMIVLPLGVVFFCLLFIIMGLFARKSHNAKTIGGFRPYKDDHIVNLPPPPVRVERENVPKSQNEERLGEHIKGTGQWDDVEQEADPIQHPHLQRGYASDEDSIPLTTPNPRHVTIHT